MSGLKYKVGDKVRIKSLDWYNKNKDNYGAIYAGNGFVFWKNMTRHCGEIMKITTVKVDPEDSNKGFYFMENSDEKWTDGMIEGLVERNGKTYPYKIGDRVVLKGNNRCATITDLKYNSWGNLSYYIKIDNDKDISIDYPTDLLLPYDKEEIERENEDKIFSEGYVQGYEDGQHDINEWVLPEGFQFKDENGNVINTTKIVLEKKKKEYPKTYKECCEVMNYCCNPVATKTTHKEGLIRKFQFLLLYRDAYWKIAGEEMGLGKPWKPDYDSGVNKFGIVCLDGVVQESNPTTNWERHLNKILDFPTRAMRDAFYENFKELIESCKELL